MDSVGSKNFRAVVKLFPLMALLDSLSTLIFWSEWELNPFLPSLLLDSKFSWVLPFVSTCLGLAGMYISLYGMKKAENDSPATKTFFVIFIIGFLSLWVCAVVANTVFFVLYLSFHFASTYFRIVFEGLGTVALTAFLSSKVLTKPPPRSDQE